MRGTDSYSESLFTTVKLEDFVPADLSPPQRFGTQKQEAGK